jgi:thiol-disulfide isomerase/thioredoxin
MKNFLLGICVVFGVMAAIREFKPAARFNKAESTLQVERLGSDGIMVHEAFNPRLAPYLAVYHGAGWCGPCQQFSPHLAEFYHDAAKTDLRFQLLMVNYDRSDADMGAYMREHKMEFPAVLRGDAGAWSASTGSGIPNLMIIDTNTGKVVVSSFRGTDYQGCDEPLRVLAKIVAQGHP